MKVYVTSDLHLGHEGTLAYAQRPWYDIEAHDDALIENINETVREDDKLYILGDFTLLYGRETVKDYLNRIACWNRYLVIGNHDQSRALFEDDAFMGIDNYMELKHRGRLVCMSHYPFLDWNLSAQHAGVTPNEASLMLHGHIHSDGDYNKRNIEQGIMRYDVGVDANDYHPVLIDDIFKKFGIHQHGSR